MEDRISKWKSRPLQWISKYFSLYEWNKECDDMERSVNYVYSENVMLEAADYSGIYKW